MIRILLIEMLYYSRYPPLDLLKLLKGSRKMEEMR